VIWSWRYGEKAGDNPWQALSLEWMTTSPPPIENFEGVPVLATGPYDYGMEKIQNTGERLRLKLRENATRNAQRQGIPVAEAQASTFFGGTATLVAPESDIDVDSPADESQDGE